MQEFSIFICVLAVFLLVTYTICLAGVRPFSFFHRPHSAVGIDNIPLSYQHRTVQAVPALTSGLLPVIAAAFAPRNATHPDKTLTSSRSAAQNSCVFFFQQKSLPVMLLLQ